MSQETIAQVGDKIRTARKSKDWDTEKLAKMANMSKSSVEKYEAGTREPSTPSLRDLAGALGVSADWLLGLKEGVDEASPIWGKLKARERELVSLWRGLEERDRKAATRMIEGLAGLSGKGERLARRRSKKQGRAKK